MRFVPAVVVTAAALLLMPAGASAALGDLDSSFDSDGLQLLNYAEEDVAREVLVQPDGKIVVVGSGETETDFLVARFLPSGAPDDSFGGGDGMIDSDGAGFEHARAAALAPDGKIVVVGNGGSLESNDDGDWWVLRYTTTGAEDPTFDGPSNGNGIVILDVWGNGRATDVTVLPDEKIVVSGTVFEGASPDVAAVRLLENGTKDPSWTTSPIASPSDNPAGVSYIPTGLVNERANAGEVQPDGKVIVAGESDGRGGSTDYDFFVARFNESGSVDDTWGASGRILPDVSTFDDKAFGTLLQADGKLVLAGASAVDPAQADFVVMRLNGADGSLDSSFVPGGDSSGNPAGIHEFGLGGPDDVGQDVALAANGKYVAVGHTDGGDNPRDFAVAVLNTDGALDTSFSGDGRRRVDFGSSSNDVAHGVAVQPDGNILLAGQVDGTADEDFGIARLIGPPPPPAAPAVGGNGAVNGSLVPAGPRTGRGARIGRCRPTSAARVRCTIVNPNPFAIAGTMAMDTARRVNARLLQAGDAQRRRRARKVKLARKRFRIAANRRATVTLRLSRKNQRFMRRIKRVRVKLASTIQDEAKISRRTTKTFTLKVYRKRQRRR
jgi:uncharacterized delta-60 repeat protein